MRVSSGCSRDPVEIYPKSVQKPRPPFYPAVVSPTTYDLTFSCALLARFDWHARLARWTVPIGLYVSVTVVAVYLMLYRF